MELNNQEYWIRWTYNDKYDGGNNRVLFSGVSYNNIRWHIWQIIAYQILYVLNLWLLSN